MLSAASKHAIRALIFLGDYTNAEFCSVAELAENTELPTAYLPKIIHALANKKIVVTKKGAGGGVALRAKTTSFYQICEALEDPIIAEHCFLSNSACDPNDHCPFHKSWGAERKRLLNFLKKNKIRKSS